MLHRPQTHSLDEFPPLVCGPLQAVLQPPQLWALNVLLYLDAIDRGRAL